DWPSVIFLQAQKRSSSAVAHERGHLLGRLHAGFACPQNPDGSGGQAEHWPPDDMGRLQGVGVDRRTLGVLFDDTFLGADGGPFYDFMSYCGVNSDEWISPKGWGETLSRLSTGAPGASLATVQSASL